MAARRAEASRSRPSAGDLRRRAPESGAEVRTAEPPPLFSKSFMEVLGQAIDEGRVSARRIADLLHLTIDDLRDLFARYAVEAPLDL